MPKPTAIGRSVWRFSRRTAAVISTSDAARVPVMPVIET